MDTRLLTPFERSLIASPLDHKRGDGVEREDGADRPPEFIDAYGQLVETLAVRKQVDGFLGSAGRLDEIGPLLLTILTAGYLFAYNRAFLLLLDPADDTLKGFGGIGALSREEAWDLWRSILDEALELKHLVERSKADFQKHNRRLAPILERLVVGSAQQDVVAEAFRKEGPTVLQRRETSGEGGWLFDLLNCDHVGVIPMWGYRGHFGAILVDNFATGRQISSDGLQVLHDFARPFISALEKALIIQHYHEKVLQLQEANARIEAQHEMILRMEKKNTMGRYSSTLAHNLLNPLVSLTGHIARLEEGATGERVRGELTGAMRGDVKDLEGFLADFIMQVEEEHPNHHFWDLNHIIGEVIISYRRFHSVLSPVIKVEEGDIPLVKVDYDTISGALSRLLGIVDLLMGTLQGLTIVTLTSGSDIHLVLRTPAPFPVALTGAAPEVREELRRLKDFLALEEIELVCAEDGFVLVIGVL